MNRTTMWLVLPLLAVPVRAGAAGRSPIEVVSIVASPGSFQAGNAVTFSIRIRNTASYRTKAGTAYLDVFKGDHLLASNHVWGATQDVLRLDAGAGTVVDFVWRNELHGAVRSLTWAVPAGDAEVFVVRAGVVDLASDRAPMKIARFERKCIYARQRPTEDSPPVTLAELKRLIRPTPR